MFILSTAIRQKIAQPDHGSVTEREVQECFLNRIGTRHCKDDREGHKTDPPTFWFVAETHLGKMLKIVYVEDEDNIYLKSAYPANKAVQDMFDRNSTD